MKKTDRFLVGIVASILVLVVVALIVALRQPPPTYQPEDTPGGVAYNYLLALQQKNYPRAYSYLSPTLDGYPADSDAFAHHLANYSWAFRFAEDTAVSIAETRLINNDDAVVRAAITQFRGEGLFGSSLTSTDFDLELRREQGGWKIWRGDRYWASCWNRAEGCR